MNARQTVSAILAIATVSVAFLVTPVVAHAQAVYGSIYGSVTDNTGAVVPNATITINDPAKGHRPRPPRMEAATLRLNI